MAKHNQRLDYARLAEVLHEREIADAGSIRELLHHSKTGGTPFAVALVTSNLVGDWDLSRIVCETFNLPFLPVEIAPPDPEAAAGLDVGFMRENGLVPLGRFGQTLTVCMPGLVPADVLGMLAADTDLVILPVVGTVQSNRRWMESNHPEASGGRRALPVDSSWSAMFDDADAAVLMDLSDVAPDGESVDEIEFEITDPEDDVEGLVEFAVDPDDPDDPDELTSESGRSSRSSGGDIELPPLPEFG